MTAVAIFVKTPGLSPVKTRLATTVGHARAEAWHLRAARTVAAVARSAGIGPVFWAVAEDEAMDHDQWQDQPAISQGSGGLGERMARVHGHLVEQFGAALLLGADAPQLDADWLVQADRWLDSDQARHCIGPASDGGFWTFGANHCIALERWQAVTYSSNETLRQFRQQIGGSSQCLDLPVLTDLDQADDLPALSREMNNLAQPLPEQIELQKWIKSVMRGPS
jgi:uncharacterized protein